MDLQKIIQTALNPALSLLPAKMDSAAARVLVLANGWQESRYLHRRQIGGRRVAFGSLNAREACVVC